MFLQDAENRLDGSEIMVGISYDRDRVMGDMSDFWTGEDIISFVPPAFCDKE